MKKLTLIFCCTFLFMYAQQTKAQVKIDRTIQSKKLNSNIKVMNYGALFTPITKTETVNGVKVTNRFYVDNAKTTTNSKIEPGVPTRKTQGKATTSKNNGWECQTQNIKVKLEDDSFMSTYNMAQSINIYPGAVYTFENFYKGSFKPEKAARNPIYVYTSLVTTGDIFESVEDPNAQDGLSIKNAVNKLKLRSKLSKANQGFKMKIYECNSSAEMAMAIGAYAQGYGAKLKFDWGSSKKKEDRYFLLDATQELFSLSANVPEEGVFQNPEDAKQTGLMFLDNVVYGMRVLVSVKTSISADQNNLSLDASYSGFGFGAGVGIEDLQKIMNETTEVKVYVVGGENSGFVTTDKYQLQNTINDAFKKLNNETAVPIYFTFRNMNNEVVRTESATDSFPVQQCIPIPPNAGLQYFNISASITNINTNVNDEESTIATRLDCELWVNGERRQLAGQQENPIRKWGYQYNVWMAEIDSNGMPVYETYYSPLIYFGKYDGGCEDELLKKYGKPYGGSIKINHNYSVGNREFTLKLTKNELENAKIILKVPFVTDYDRLNECTTAPNSGTAYQEVYLKDLIATNTKTYTLMLPHKNDNTYYFPVTVSVSPVSPAEYAPEPEEENKLDIIKARGLKKTMNQNAPAKKLNINIKK